ncbi:DNA repair protein [Melanogaster broomeanus]|nr:DNA repair protein [Melanogaster broomeanus]
MHATTSAKKQQEHVTRLQAEVDALQNGRLGPNEDAEEIVSNYIKHLHRYNEAKDAAQSIIGRLATLKQTTIRQIHYDMGLLDDDAK